MRNGKILSEDKPQALQEKHQLPVSIFISFANLYLLLKLIYITDLWKLILKLL